MKTPIIQARVDEGRHRFPELGLPTNAELVARTAQPAKTMGPEVATAARTRQMLRFERPQFA